MARAAVEEHEDASIRPGGKPRERPLAIGAQKARQRQSPQADRAGLQYLPARDFALARGKLAIDSLLDSWHYDDEAGEGRQYPRPVAFNNRTLVLVYGTAFAAFQ